MSDLQQQLANIELQQSEPLQEQTVSPVNSNVSSPSSSISLIRLDELSSAGATRQSRLPALIKLNEQQLESHLKVKQPISMPAIDAEQIEKMEQPMRRLSSLPAQNVLNPLAGNENLEKENVNSAEAAAGDDFQVVDMVSSDADFMGPSLPQPQVQGQAEDKLASHEGLVSSQQVNHQHPSHLGDSLIEMVINLRNENQNLVRALETNNEYVKERISDFKRLHEESRKRETQFALERAEHEHQMRKLQRQNSVLSDRLKIMEAKLKDMKEEVSESLDAARSSKASSLRDYTAALEESNRLYPNLSEQEPLSTTMQIDATSGELYNNTNARMDTDVGPKSGTGQAGPSDARLVGAMNKEELSKRFDADKTAFYAMDDPLKQCDKLEQQLNDIGKRDYEICLLQHQLNIYRQDFRLERMANLEAKIQIERLKNDIDKLCLERIQEKSRMMGGGQQTSSSDDDATKPKMPTNPLWSQQNHRNVRFDTMPAAAAAAEAVSKLGHHIGKKAARQAVKAAKYASKQAHREEKVAAAVAAAAAANAAAAAGAANDHYGSQSNHHSHSRRHSHQFRNRAVRSEVVNDLLSTANKAMLTGYKMASTHVNLALDKLSAYEQSQASQLAQNSQPGEKGKPSAPPMEPPSMD